MPRENVEKVLEHAHEFVVGTMNEHAAPGLSVGSSPRAFSIPSKERTSSQPDRVSSIQKRSPLPGGQHVATLAASCRGRA